MFRQRGFTLVELVIVIVLLGIVATISTQFVSLSVRGAIDLGDRQQRALQGVVISEQITREVREAFPLSVRENDGCLEWLPILGATTYTSLPTESNSNTLEFQPFGQTIREGARLIVYGYGSSQDRLYEPSRSAPYSGPVSPGIEEVGPADEEVSFAVDYRFLERSPQKRLYAVGNPISICQLQNSRSKKLYRFTNYIPDTADPRSVGGLLSDAGDIGVMSVNLVENKLVWQVIPPSLKRSAVVNFGFELSSLNRTKTETTRVSQEVQIRNVP